MSELVYTRVHKQESWGSGGGLGIEINIAASRELSREEKSEISTLAGKIAEVVLEKTIAMDPKAQDEAKAQRASLLALFPTSIYVEEIPNGYCNQYCCKHLPWFIVTTPIGRIKIGYRKRVINIDWTDTLVKKCGKELFPEEDVTRSDKWNKEHFIHAWGYEKAKEYITYLLTV